MLYTSLPLSESPSPSLADALMQPSIPKTASKQQVSLIAIGLPEDFPYTNSNWVVVHEDESLLYILQSAIFYYRLNHDRLLLKALWRLWLSQNMVA